MTPMIDIHRDILDRAQNTLRLILQAEDKREFYQTFLNQQRQLLPTENFLFRSEKETLDKIDLYDRMIDRLIQYYNSTVPKLIINRLKKHNSNLNDTRKQQHLVTEDQQ